MGNTISGGGSILVKICWNICLLEIVICGSDGATMATTERAKGQRKEKMGEGEEERRIQLTQKPKNII